MQDSMQTPQAPQTQPSSIPLSAPASPAAIPSTSVATASPSPVMTPAQAAPQWQAPPAESTPNPWQEAYQRLASGMSGMLPSQPQAPSWVTTQPAPQAPAAPAWVAPQVSYPAPQPAVSYQAPPSVSAPAIWPQQAIQAYPSPQTWEQSWDQSWASNEEPDGYLSDVSDESLEVLGHFGAEAPALLNAYACTVEDALLAQAEQSLQALQAVQALQQNVHQLQTVIGAAGEQVQAYNRLLTDPDLLADYVNDFYGPNGPHPIETSTDRLRTEVEAGGYHQVGSAPAYQRPQLEMPAPSSQPPADPSQWWDQFNRVSERNPEMLWQILEQAPSDALRAKLLISES